MSDAGSPATSAHGTPAEFAANGHRRSLDESGPQLHRQGQAAFRAGWLTAQLYGPIIDRGSHAGADHLPSISELRVADRVDLAMRELEDALVDIAVEIGCQEKLDAVKAEPRSGTWHDPFKNAIMVLHRTLLIELTARDPRLGHAYGLGCSLSDTAWLPTDQNSLQRELNPYRVAEVDGWLSNASELLGDEAVKAVRGSLQMWAAWVSDPFIRRRKLNWVRDGMSTKHALRRQGAVWHDLLSGERDPSTVLSAETHIRAADIAVRRAGFLARQVVVHFWYAVVPLLVAVGGLIYLSVTYAAGTAKFWGAFVAAVGGSGALVQGVRRSLSHLAHQTGAPLWRVERDDALQVGATRLPVGATSGRVRRRVRPREFRRSASTVIQPE
jgi:hypothetical protein